MPSSATSFLKMCLRARRQGHSNTKKVIGEVWREFGVLTHTVLLCKRVCVNPRSRIWRYIILSTVADCLPLGCSVRVVVLPDGDSLILGTLERV